MMVSFVASELAPPGTLTTWQSKTFPRVSHDSQIEMRLLRDTRRVLEYLSKEECGQPCVYDMFKMMKHRWALQLPEYVSSVEQVIQIIKFIA